MRRTFLVCVAASATLFPVVSPAQNTIDALDRELKDAQQQHVEVSNKILTAFFAQADAGMASPDAAITIFTNPEGINMPPPPPLPVVTQNEHETQTEKEKRVAADQANLLRFGSALQLHCGLLHYGALMIIDPSRAGLQAAFAQWLKASVPTYLQMAPPPDTTTPDAPEPPKKQRDNGAKHRRDRPAGQAGPYSPSDVKGKTLRESPITKFNNFGAFRDGDQGGWSVHDFPRLYRTNVLDPLRAKPTMATHAAWDSVIAMANADEPDSDRWNNETNPGLQFDRACDAYVIAPSTETLEVLVNFIKQNPTHPKIDDWISRVHGFVKDYRDSHGLHPAQTPAPVTTTPSGTPGVNVTTEQQGDMTIITTHTNGAPVAPAPH